MLLHLLEKSLKGDGNYMLSRDPVKKILRKYKNKSIKNLSSYERTEVLKLMDSRLERGVINMFIRDDNGGVSSQTMSLPTYFSYLQKKQGDLTVGEVMQKIQSS